MRPVTPRTSGDGPTCRDPPDCGGRLTPVGWTDEHRRPRVKGIGSKTVARQTEQMLHSTTKTITEKEETP